MAAPAAAERPSYQEAAMRSARDAILDHNAAWLLRALSAAPEAVDARGDDGRSTLLAAACEEGAVECVRALLAVGADVDARVNDAGETAVHVCVARRQPGCLRALLAAPRRPDLALATVNGDTAAVHAAKLGFAPALAALLAAGAPAEGVFDAALEGECAAALALVLPPPPRAAGAGTRRSGAARAEALAADLVAATWGDAAAVGNLVRAGYGAGSPELAAALHVAAAGGHVDAVDALLGAGVSPNAASRGTTALHRAAARGKAATVVRLVRGGADVNRPSELDGGTALAAAAAYPLQYTVNVALSIVRPLLRAGADVRVASRDGRTALLAACENRSVHAAAIVGELLSAGADANDTLGDGRSALALVLEANRPDMARLLLEAGAGTAAPLRAGPQGLACAIQAGLPAAVVEAILASGVDPGKTGRTDGLTPLALAALHGQPDHVAALVAAGAAVDGRCGDGDTPLMHAAKVGAIGSLRALLAAGAAADAASESADAEARGWTALHVAVGDCAQPRAAEELVAALLGAGASVNARNELGDTAFSLFWAIMEERRAYRRSWDLTLRVGTRLLTAGAEVPAAEPGAPPREDALRFLDLRAPGWRAHWRAEQARVLAAGCALRRRGLPLPLLRGVLAASSAHPAPLLLREREHAPSESEPEDFSESEEEDDDDDDPSDSDPGSDDDGGGPYAGCGNPDCPNCGGGW